MTWDNEDPFFSEHAPRRTGHLKVRPHLQPAPIKWAVWAHIFTRKPDGGFHFMTDDNWDRVDELLVEGKA